jgi:hypothetical protein
MDYVIKLKNGLSFVVVKKYVLEGEKYLYLASATDNPECIFAKCVDDKTIEPVQDQETLNKLVHLVVEELKEMQKQ